jgi:hypothetical protein
MTAFQDEGAVYNRVKQDLSVYNFTEFPTFEAMSGYIGEEIGDWRLPYLDRKAIPEETLTADQRYWREHGYIVFEKIIPDELINRYLDLRSRAGLGRGGFPNLAPYDSFGEIRDLNLYAPLMERVEKMLGYRVALHFNLSGFTSTERGWHQDDYMADPLVAASGIAMWFALDDIHPDAGPFEFVPGSHRWPIMRMPKVIKYLRPEVLDNRENKYEFWAHLAEYYVNPAFEAEMRRRGAAVKVFHARKGDVLIWHGGLVHRGAHPKNNAIDRPAIIAHYCDPNRHHVHLGVKRVHRTGYQYISFPTQPKLKAVDGKLVEWAPPKSPYETYLKPLTERLRARLRTRLERVAASL